MGITKDRNKAIEYFKEAAREGDAEALLHYGQTLI